jgi:DNA-directed RNA polymerase subunit RPC12/RpoP
MRLIDADALKKHYAWWEDDKQKLFDSIVDSQPTVDAVPVRYGKWLYGESESGQDGYYCSQCGKHIKWRYGEEDIDFIRSYNYCPNCGARMRDE